MNTLKKKALHCHSYKQLRKWRCTVLPYLSLKLACSYTTKKGLRRNVLIYLLMDASHRMSYYTATNHGCLLELKIFFLSLFLFLLYDLSDSFILLLHLTAKHCISINYSYCCRVRIWQYVYIRQDPQYIR